VAGLDQNMVRLGSQKVNEKVDVEEVGQKVRASFDRGQQQYEDALSSSAFTANQKAGSLIPIDSLSAYNHQT
jgi:hypothetical protein